VWIDRGYARAELRIVLGVVEPHLMAGYSGGAKSVCPGLARLDTVRGIHRAALARANVGPGIVQGNPFRAEIAAATRLAGVEFSIQVCASRGGVPTFVSAGDLDATAAESTAFAASRACVAAGTTHEVVLTTGGGAPLDRTLYQAAKGWAAAAGVVRPGGHLLLVAQLSEGIGTRAFEAALVDSRHADAPSPVNGPDSGAPAGVGLGSWMVQHIAQLRARGRLHVVSSLPAERLEALGFGAHRTVQEALAALCPAVTERSLLILPQGPYCVPTVSGRLLTLEGAPAA
jgi:nickel-dependent lactate racemase